jgi:hypothetical protein
MDVHDFWQENKRFLGVVGSGLGVFLVGMALIERFVGSELKAQARAAARAEAQLAEPSYSAEDLSLAESDDQDLRTSLSTLRRAVDFEPRPDFRLDGEGSAQNRYFAAVAAVREELMALAVRADLSIPSDLGLPALAPTRAAEIERHLLALDAIDRLVRLSMEAGVERIDEIRIRLDPALLAGRGLGTVERTRIECVLSGASAGLVSLLLLTQSDPAGTPLLIESAEMNNSRTQHGEARLDLTLLVVKLHGLDEEDPAP